MKNFWLPLLISTSVATHGWAQVQLDGEFGDWTSGDLVATDPVGDAENLFDISMVFTRVEGKTVYVRFDNTVALNLAAGDQSDGTLQLVFELPRDRTLTVDFRDRMARLNSSGASVTLPWDELNFAALPTYAAKDFEVRIDFKQLAVRSGDIISMQLAGSDQLNESIEIQMGGETLGSPAASVTFPEAAFRIASMNTLRGGASDPERRDEIAELVAKVQPDVLLLNEEHELQKLESSIGTLLGASSRTGLNLEWRDCGLAITTRHKLERLDFAGEQNLACLVRTDDDRQYAIVAVHLECCGYAGSPEDKRRIDEANTIAKSIKQLRKGEYGEEISDVPVIVMGDYNLVGSRDPLTIIEGAGMTAIMMRSPYDDSTLTWRGIRPNESFWPGRLDWATISDPDLVSSGVLVDQRMLGPNAEPISDHAMMVVDLKEHAVAACRE